MVAHNLRARISNIMAASYCFNLTWWFPLDHGMISLFAVRKRMKKDWCSTVVKEKIGFFFAWNKYTVTMERSATTSGSDENNQKYVEILSLNSFFREKLGRTPFGQISWTNLLSANPNTMPPGYKGSLHQRRDLPQKIPKVGGACEYMWMLKMIIMVF